MDKKENLVVASKKLAIHTLKIVNNINNYPKKFRFSLVEKINVLVLDILELSTEYSKTKDNQTKEMILIKCKTLRQYIEVTLEVIHPKTSTAYWCKLIEKVEQSF